MINYVTLLGVLTILLFYILVTFMMVPCMRKMLKLVLYILVFVGLIFPSFKGIGNLEMNLETYAIVLAGVEVFEMLFKFRIEELQRKGKNISKKSKKIYESM